MPQGYLSKAFPRFQSIYAALSGGGLSGRSACTSIPIRALFWPIRLDVDRNRRPHLSTQNRSTQAQEPLESQSVRDALERILAVISNVVLNDRD
jgi:hypothetical protein